MYKRIITRILIGILTISAFTACGNSKQGDDKTSPIVAGSEANSSTSGSDAAKSGAGAAKSEDASAFYEAGRAALYGLNGQAVSYETAYKNFTQALENGKTEANFYLGLLCDWYNYPQTDYAKAKSYYEAAEDHQYARIALGFLYYHGQGVKKDAAKAKELFDAVITDGFEEAYLGKGSVAMDEKNYAEALKHYTKAAAGEEPVYVADAMRELGWMYSQGLGVKQDHVKALEWYQKAADLGAAAAMNNIGYMYQNGFGVKADYIQAAKWYDKAANLGQAEAMMHLGFMYFQGFGVKQDYAKAMEWNKKAADLGEAVAMKNIGYMYEQGMGVTKNAATAKEWYDKAKAAE